jgi:glycine cleavage system H protein
MECMSEMKAAVDAGAVPKEGEFDQGRFWFSRRGNILTIGLTSRALDTLGDLEGIEVPEDGDVFDAGDDFLTIEGTTDSIGLSLPSRGTVVEVNPMTGDPAAVAEDPLEEGWLVRFEIDDLEVLKDL